MSAAGSHLVPLFASDLELFEQRGVSGNVRRPPPPNLYERLPLHCLDEVALCPKGRFQDFL